MDFYNHFINAVRQQVIRENLDPELNENKNIWREIQVSIYIIKE